MHTFAEHLQAHIISGNYIATFMQTIAKVMPPPPAATALAIHPNDNNILVFGMEDSSIQIFQFRTRQACFSTLLNL